MESFKLPTMNDIYAGRTVFVTGATGFVMVEKMLHSLPSIKRIYVLIRPLRGKSSTQRWMEYEKLPLFNRIRRDCPERLAKVEIIEGDIAMPDLGIAQDDLAIVIRETSIVFHCAAIIRLNAPLKEAVNVNMQGTVRVLAMCRRMPKLECYLHCSTCYVNADRRWTIVEEKMYPPPCDPYKLIEEKEAMSDVIFESIGQGAAKLFGNNYCFTKCLSEHLVMDSNLPAIIYRSSGIGSIWKDGIPGWADVFQGVSGLTALFCTGAISRIPIDINDHIDAIPVDVVSSSMIVSAAYRTCMSGMTTPVIHCNTSSLNPLVYKDVWSTVVESVFKYPLNKMLSTPVLSHGGSDELERSMHRLREKCVGPVLDKLLEMAGQKPFFTRLYARVAESYAQVRRFLTGYTFKTDNLVKLMGMMTEEDKEVFEIDVRKINWIDYCHDNYFGVKVFLMKDGIDDESIRRARRNLQLHRLKDFITTFVFCFLCTYFFTGSAKSWFIYIPLTLFFYCYFSVFAHNPSVGMPSIENYKKRVEEAMGESLKPHNTA